MEMLEELEKLGLQLKNPKKNMAADGNLAGLTFLIYRHITYIKKK